MEREKSIEKQIRQIVILCFVEGNKFKINLNKTDSVKGKISAGWHLKYCLGNGLPLHRKSKGDRGEGSEGGEKGSEREEWERETMEQIEENECWFDTCFMSQWRTLRP